MSVKVTMDWKGPEFAAAVDRAAVSAVSAGAIVLQAQMKRTLSGSSPSSPGNPPGVDRGQLRQSITFAQEGKTARVGTGLKYGRWLEYGFTATAQRVSRLPVPANREARRMLRTLNIGPGGRVSLRSKNLKFVPRKGKDPLLVERVGKDGSIGGAVFVLKKRVTIAARPWVLPSVSAARARMIAAMRKRFADELAKSATRAKA